MRTSNEQWARGTHVWRNTWLLLLMGETHMAALTDGTMHAARIPTSRILRTGALAAVLAALANTIVRVLAVTLQPVDPGFTALGWAPPALFTLAGAIGAMVVFWIISRRARHPASVFTRVAVAVLLPSLIPDLLLLQHIGPLQFPGATAWTVGALMVMHVVAFAIIMPLLNRTAHVS